MQVAIDLLVYSSGSREETLLGDVVTLRCQQLICDGRPLFDRELVQRLLASILIFDNARSWIVMWAVDYPLSHLVEVVGSHRLRERKLASKYGGNTNLVWLNIDIRRNDGACSIVDTFSLSG